MKVIIAGGGISGLALGYLLSREPKVEVEVYEAENRPGGKIRTETVDGFLCEWGVNGFLSNKPRTFELASAIGLSPLRSNDNARKRYIFSDGRLHLLPEKPPAFLKSGLMTMGGKLRIMLEPFRSAADTPDETLERFAVRRLGREAYEKLIDPMASGIFAGDSRLLSLRSCFPRIFELERTYGSLIKAMFRLKKEARKTGREVGAGPGGVLTSFHDGMQVIIDGLRRELAGRLILGAGVSAVEPSGSRWTASLSDGARAEADVMVLATPAHATAKAVRGVRPWLSDLLERIPYPSVAVVCLGFKRGSIQHALDGFGFLITGREGRGILGTLWDSSIFPGRAPDGYVLLRSILGGARASARALESEDRIVETVRGELRSIMGITAAPDLARVYRHERAIPQYNIGHQEILSGIDGIMRELPGLYLSGNAYRGIGLNDCIEGAYTLRDKILNR